MMTNSSASAGKVKCSYGVPKCKSNRQNFFHIERKNRMDRVFKKDFSTRYLIKKQGLGASEGSE